MTRYRFLATILACSLAGCEMRSDSELFSDVFGFHFPVTWVVTKRVQSGGDPQTFYFLFDLPAVAKDTWKPESAAYTAWRPMTAEQRFVSGKYVLEGASFGPSTRFCFKREQRTLVLIYDEEHNRVIALKAHNAMGVK